MFADQLSIYSAPLEAADEYMKDSHLMSLYDLQMANMVKGMTVEQQSKYTINYALSREMTTVLENHPIVVAAKAVYSKGVTLADVKSANFETVCIWFNLGLASGLLLSIGDLIKNNEPDELDAINRQLDIWNACLDKIAKDEHTYNYYEDLLTQSVNLLYAFDLTYGGTFIDMIPRVNDDPIWTYNKETMRVELN